MNNLIYLLLPFYLLSTSFNVIPHTYDGFAGQSHVFQNEEEIVYKIYYNLGFIWMPAGEVTFKLKESKEELYVKAIGKTYSSYEWFFKVEDVYESWMDKKTLYPTKSVRSVKEGDYRLYDKIFFDQKSNFAISHRGDDAEDTRMTKYKLSSEMHDILSLIYYTRNLDIDKISKGEKIPLKMFMDKKEQSLSMTYQGKYTRKKIKNNGRKDVLLFEPELIGGDTFKEGDKMKLWVSSNLGHVPYMIESPLSVGSIKVVLKSAQNVDF